MKKYDVYGIGNALVDYEFELQDEQLSSLGIDKGLMTLIDEERHHALLEQLEGTASRQASGGSAANTIIGAAQLGAATFYSCKVASDATGDFYMHDLHANGVTSNLGMDNREAGVTGKCLVMVTPDAERSMNTFLGITSRFNTRELDLDALAASSILYIEGYLVTEDNARAAAVTAREAAEAAGVTTALTLSDPNMVQFFRDGLLQMAGERLDLAFSNQAEAELMFDASNLNDAIAGMKTLARRFAITRGAEGAVLFDGENLIEVATPQVKAVDSNGAGDIYAGSFLYGLSRNLPFGDCGALASSAAAELVTQYGPRLQRERMQELLAQSGLG